jgi:coatomer subunit beta
VSTLSSIESGEVFHRILWVLGKYIEDNEGITVAVQEVWKVIRELPIGASKQRALEEMNGRMRRKRTLKRWQVQA